MINFVTCAFETSSLFLSKLFQLKRYTRSPYHSSDSTLCRLVLGPLLIRLIFTIVTRILDTSVPCSPCPLVLGTEHCQRSQQSPYSRQYTREQYFGPQGAFSSTPVDLPPKLPDCHILVLIDFQDLEQLAHRGDAHSRNFDLLDTHNYEHCSHNVDL